MCAVHATLFEGALNLLLAFFPPLDADFISVKFTSVRKRLAGNFRVNH